MLSYYTPSSCFPLIPCLLVLSCHLPSGGMIFYQLFGFIYMLRPAICSRWLWVVCFLWVSGSNWCCSTHWNHKNMMDYLILSKSCSWSLSVDVINYRWAILWFRHCSKHHSNLHLWSQRWIGTMPINVFSFSFSGSTMIFYT